ncbi:hypothetical protein C7M84_012265 [Penaeus vannamei]|uniref:Amidase domain-containing protein n=1 Tax=Penaeus vannamei TaxID=6689 RepID=A0A3R7PF57_PENVA|nr:hypothetical protein C7M84_012265 [Penaeus vannamei]
MGKGSLRPLCFVNKGQELAIRSARRELRGSANRPRGMALLSVTYGSGEEGGGEGRCPDGGGTGFQEEGKERGGSPCRRPIKGGCRERQSASSSLRLPQLRSKAFPERLSTRRNMQCSKTKEKLQEAVEQRRKEVRAALDKLEASLSAGAELLTEERLAILALPPDILLHRLKEGHLTPTAVLRAFQAKAMVVTYRINCVTEFIPQAEDWASALEEDPQNRSLPLYGLPVSIKENFEVEGMDTTLGLAKYLYQPAPRHAALVQVLRLQGAVPFCKTNVPQSLVSYRCSNPVWGETLNPVDTQRTCGGSSGN